MALGRGRGGADRASLAACQEKLTSPAECPALCPGGSRAGVRHVVIAVALRDSSFPGHRDSATPATSNRGQGTRCWSPTASRPARIGRSTGSPPGGDRSRCATRCAAIRSIRSLVDLTSWRATRWSNGLKVVPLPAATAVDSTATFAGVDSQLVDAELHRQHRRARHASTPARSGRCCAARTSGRLGAARRWRRRPGHRAPDGRGLADRDPRGRAAGRARRLPTRATSRSTSPTPARSASRSLPLTPTFNTFVTQTPLVPDDSCSRWAASRPRAR